MPRAIRPVSAIGVILAAYPAFLAMMAMHEAGHVLHALLSGGQVREVRLPLWGFSQTILAHNPHPQFVAWGGFVWGCVLPTMPLGVWLAAAGIRSRGHPSASRQRPALLAVRNGLLVFGGFCLIANGAYIGVGAFADRAGDAADLLRHGAPRSLLAACGALAMLAGLWLWHIASRPAPSYD